MKHTDNCGRTAPIGATMGCSLACKCRCHYPLYGPSVRVIASWERGDLAEAVRQLARAVEEFEAAAGAKAWAERKTEYIR